MKRWDTLGDQSRTTADVGLRLWLFVLKVDDSCEQMFYRRVQRPKKQQKKTKQYSGPVPNHEHTSPPDNSRVSRVWLWRENVTAGITGKIKVGTKRKTEKILDKLGFDWTHSDVGELSVPSKSSDSQTPRLVLSLEAGRSHSNILRVSLQPSTPASSSNAGRNKFTANLQQRNGGGGGGGGNRWKRREGEWAVISWGGWSCSEDIQGVRHRLHWGWRTWFASQGPCLVQSGKQLWLTLR